MGERKAGIFKMMPKLVVLTVFMIALAGCVLMLRQERLNIANQIGNLHSQVVQTRLDIWQAQSDAAKLIRPQDLQIRLNSSQLAMESVSPAPSHGTASPNRTRRTPGRNRTVEVTN